MKFFYLLLLLFILSFSFKSQTFTDALSANPNPFYDRTQLNYSFSNNDTVTIYVMNELGQTVLTLFTNSVMPAGNYQDSLLFTTAPAQGIYFVLMKLGHRKNITAKIVKTGPLAITDHAADQELNIYPNPNTGLIFIQSSLSCKLLGIYSAMGELLFTFKESSFSGFIDMKDYPVGLYFIRYNHYSKETCISLIKE